MIYLAAAIFSLFVFIALRMMFTERPIAYLPADGRFYKGEIRTPTIMELWKNPDVGNYFQYKDKFGVSQSRPVRKLKNLLSEEEHTIKLLE